AELEKAEKIRLLWIDGPPFWGMELNTLLKEEFGAKIVMDMNAYISASALIDTSTEQSMFEGLASRNTYNPIMVNVVQNTIVDLLERIEFIVEAYNIDCVIGPGHMGHKDCSASLGMITDTCRRIGVPILNYKFDLFDPRYTTIDEMKVIFSTFFDAMGLG
ncbi:MAG: 2-hydroxyacyl-CoA dehydratase, partial [Bacteroidetes bacterium]